MEEFFQFESPRQVFWIEEEAFPVKQSAFVRYQPSIEGFESNSCGLKSNTSNNQSVNKRIIEFLRRSWNPATAEGRESERERCFRHMISERMRREKQKRSYSALHSLLPPGTKSDKNSTVLVAAKEVEDLRKCKEELERRNEEIERILAAREGGKTEGAKVRLRVSSPSSGIDSMVEVLKCLKSMGSTIKAIQSELSANELSAVLEIESEIEAGEVEKAMQRTLFEVERKLRVHCPI